MKLDETTLIFQSIYPKNPAVMNVAKNALMSGSMTNHIDPKKRYSINANIKATAEPKIIRSDSMYSIISVAIIDGPPR